MDGSEEPKILALITARGGSKGVPGKNIRSLAGKPLVAWTVKHALCARRKMRTIISSDDTQIIQAAIDAGCEAPFVRPAELSRDDTPSAAVAIHALNTLAAPYDILVLLQPTSPLRIPSDIDACVDFCLKSEAQTCISISECAKPPHLMFRLDEAGRISRFIKEGAEVNRRQELVTAYVPNGAVYVARVDWFRSYQKFIDEQTFGVVMPPERSIDIDTEWDLRLAAMILKDRLRQSEQQQQ